MTTSSTDTVNDLEVRRDLHGKNAIVTGSTSGIGAAIAQTLAARGARVVVSGRDPERGGEIVDSIATAGGSAVFVASDLGGTHEQVRDFARRAAHALDGSVDILVNNAGVYPAPPSLELSDEDLDQMLAVNIRAPHVLFAALVPGMIERGGGVVVNIGSWMARTGTPYAAMYTATKAAEEQLTRAWAAEFGQRGIRVNTVAPGATLTPGNAGSKDILDAMTASTPAGGVVNPADVAAGVAFVVSDEAALMHGAILDIDGGISSTRM